MGWGYGHMDGVGWFGMVLGSLFLVVLVLGVVALLVGARRWGGGRTTSGMPGSGRPSPGQVLAERYARGEIDDEEYRRRLSTLQDSGLSS